MSDNTMFKKDLPAELVSQLCTDSEKTLQFLAETKWKEGYHCRKCGHSNYCEGKSPYSRRCTRCKAEESATAHTLFHNIKFPVNKAFYIAYQVCVVGKAHSTYDYSEQLGLNQMTCWKFRKRIKECVLRHSSGNRQIPLQTLLLEEY